MRSIEIGLALAASLLSACGSSSSGALFGNVNDCGSAISCGLTGIGGNGGSQGSDGGAGNLGGQAAGGSGSTGGQQSSGGDVGSGNSGNAGGDVGSGGHGSGGSDIGAGGNVDSGAQVGAGGAQPASCPTGDYHAVLTGSYRSITGARDIGATIDFSVSDVGALQGAFVGPGTAKATVTGSLDCATLVLTATIENGAYQLGLATAKFSGNFDGNYDPGAAAFDGTWVITETGSPNNGGNGPWSTR